MASLKDNLKTYLTALVYGQKKGRLQFFLQLILKLFSCIYLCLLTLVRLGYAKGVLRSYRPNCKVISVGNITLGGTGKTPLVIMLAGYLRDNGHKVAVLTRGYGPGNEPDEAMLLKKQLNYVSVLVGADRAANVKEAQLKYEVDAVILDDGFQHWKMERDLDIVAVDGVNPFGNRCLLPGGMLREPVSSLKRANVIILTYSKQSDTVPDEVYHEIKKNNPQALVLKSWRAPVCFSKLGSEGTFELKALGDEPVGMFCGIGNPDGFHKTLSGVGGCIKVDFIFPDHYLYFPEDLGRIVTVCKERGVKKVVTTQKDAMRLDWFEGIIRGEKAQPEKQVAFWNALKHNEINLEFWVLHVEMKFSDEQRKEFENRLSGLYRG